MPFYAPNTFAQQVLSKAVNVPGYIGNSSRRKLRRRYGKRAIAEFKACLEKLGPEDIVLDLGANLGDFSLMMAKTGAQIHAYEPDPDTIAKLTRRFESTDNVTVHGQAVGNETGQVKLRRMKDYDADPDRHSQGSSVVFADERMNDEDTVDVEMISFWELIGSFDRPVSLIKMDIEGAEWDILAALFSKPEPFGFGDMFVETHELVDPSKYELVEGYRKRSDGFQHSNVNLYWP